MGGFPGISKIVFGYIFLGSVPRSSSLRLRSRHIRFHAASRTTEPVSRARVRRRASAEALTNGVCVTATRGVQNNIKIISHKFKHTNARKHHNSIRPTVHPYLHSLPGHPVLVLPSIPTHLPRRKRRHSSERRCARAKPRRPRGGTTTRGVVHAMVEAAPGAGRAPPAPAAA